MINALIVDDEAPSRDTLKGKLELFCPEVEVSGEAASVEQALTFLREKPVDLLFLDIDLDGGSGFDILTTLRDEESLNPAVVFITAHDEFAIKAIRFSALDYLLKPIDPEELVKAVRRAEEEKGIPRKASSLNVLMENIRQASGTPKKIVVPTSKGLYVVPIADIIRLESSSNYTVFQMYSEKPLMASRTLKEFDQMLEGYRFFRPHKSHLINLNFLVRYVPQEGGYLVMEDNAHIPVANRKKEPLMQELRKL
ncbi:MAG: LytTR family DNA-binding domain-containing protein [Schleiferiaceae bacterium]|nr:LytTR family DNA-binding domain-containing protein [Schleiferiaceae bacterium]MDR9441738.1 LytTR family DNA-binding domain-containing protein [Schleiferiaceae bacterium]